MNSCHYNKEIFVKDYFDIHSFYVNYYNRISNNNILILMQVGSFHECYNTDNEGPKLNIIGEKLDMVVTMKNKNKPLSTSNPRMMGFPSYIVDDVIDKIISIGYTVVRIDQTSEPPNPKREVVGIFSPSTQINSSICKNIVCIAIDGIKLKTANPLLCIGLASYCMMTGEGSIYEIASSCYDTMLSLDGSIRFLEKYPPAEIVFFYSKNIINYIETNKTINRMTLNDISRYIGINDNITTYKVNNENITNPLYQTNIVSKIFNNMDIENLHAYNMARIALVGILEFTTNHMPLLLNKLTKPKYFDQINTLYLGNKALEQLDIITQDDKNISLYKVICNTRTPMGKRLLKDNLCNPLICPIMLQERYNIIEKLLENKLFESLYNNLINIADLPKLVRKIELKKIYPNEFANFYFSFIQINNTVNILNKDIQELFKVDTNLITIISDIIGDIEGVFDIEYISTLNFIYYKEETKNFIINNKYSKITELEKSIMIGNNFMEHLVKELEKLIEEKNKKIINKEQTIITLKYNDREGHYMLLTKRRCKILRENLKKIENIKIGTTIINIVDLEFTDLPKSNNTKISCKDIIKISVDVVELKSKLAAELKIAFYIEVTNLITKYREKITDIIKIIENIDFLNSGAICAYNNGYHKPTIIEKDNSYFKATKLRHPIIESISDNTTYQPHDISIGLDKVGILLYGINSSGKSTLMKSIGLNIVMAQIGYYVAASEFTFSPYYNIFTRIIGTDNIFRGMSSFMVEMMELMAILKRNTNKTLVLGDEICRGTEEKSANIIVAYMLETLAESKTSFITATHLHSIADLPSVKNIKNINIMHLKIDYDSINDTLIYCRELKEGQGDKYYGVMVAKYLMKTDHFNNRTKELEMEYENYTVKKSNYNKGVLMIDCKICKETKGLETHHINFQKDCDDIKVIDKPHIKKNKPYNLVVLCSKCHDMIDRGCIIVNGWVQTSDNTILDWYHSRIPLLSTIEDLENPLLSKIQLDTVDIINEYKMKNLSTTKVKKLIKSKHNINISEYTIKKVLKIKKN